MTVIELIELLKSLPQEATVLVAGYEGDYDWAEVPKIIYVKFEPETPWYYGQWKTEDDDYNYLTVETGTAAVVIGQRKDPEPL